MKHSDPLMWVEALDLVLAELRDEGVDLGAHARHQRRRPAARLGLPGRAPIGGCWSADKPLVEQVRPLLSRATAPIWMDSSTSAECARDRRAPSAATSR